MEVIRNAKPLDDETLTVARRVAWAFVQGRYMGEPIGRGHFSVALPLNDDLIVKVGGPGGYGTGDPPSPDRTCFTDYAGRPESDSWPLYVKWTGNMRRRPSWAPKVHHLEYLRGRLYFAVCERLERVGGYPSVPVAECIVARAAPRYGAAFDLHNNNYMARRNGVTVINDPWCPAW